MPPFQPRRPPSAGAVGALPRARASSDDTAVETWPAGADRCHNAPDVTRVGLVAQCAPELALPCRNLGCTACDQRHNSGVVRRRRQDSNLPSTASDVAALTVRRAKSATYRIPLPASRRLVVTKMDATRFADVTRCGHAACGPSSRCAALFHFFLTGSHAPASLATLLVQRSTTSEFTDL